LTASVLDRLLTVRLIIFNHGVHESANRHVVRRRGEPTPPPVLNIQTG
jgi:hypothetical protein